MDVVKDSSDFSPTDWIALRDLILDKHHEHKNILVLHGTDTMAYTSSAMSLLLHDFQKNIVFTGAQIPISEVGSDGKINVLGSLTVLDKMKSMNIDCKRLLHFGGKTFVANRVSKVNTSTFEAFDGDIYMLQQDTNKKAIESPSFNDLKEIETNVVLVKMYPGIDLNAIMTNLLNHPPKGILIESFGMGNIAINNSFIEGLERLITKGLVVLNISQCSRGSVNMQVYETGKKLESVGVINGKDMTTEAAITKLMLVLSLPTENKRQLLTNSIVGEITQLV